MLKIDYSEIGQISFFQLTKLGDSFLEFICGAIFFDVVTLGVLAFEKVMDSDVHLGSLVKFLGFKKLVRALFQFQNAFDSLSGWQLKHVLFLLNVQKLYCDYGLFLEGFEELSLKVAINLVIHMI